MSREYPCVYYDNEKCTLHGSEPDYIDWCVLGPCSHETPSNADHIRSMSDEELAERNVRKIKTPVTGCYDYGESYTDYYDAWETSDGAIFWTPKPAIEYELHWLRQSYKEET